MIKKTIVIAGQQGERGDKAEEYSVPIDGVLGFTETGTPDGYVEAGYFKVTGLDEVDSRIDVIESLPEGSTSGDAEVADIRVGVDGEIYDSAGIAVRDQITELHDYAESIDDVQDAQIETLKVTKAVEGEYITINDAAALPANEYELTLSPVQSLNGYDSPWVGGAGKNKFDGEIEQGALNPSNGENTPNTQRYRSKNYIPVKPNTTYKVSVDGTATSANLFSYGSDKSFLSDVDKPYANQITTSANTYYLRFFGTDSLNSTKVQIEEGQTATAWTPYSNICPIHGADEVGVRVCGKNFWSIDTYFGKADGSGSYTYANDTLTLTGKYYFQFNIEVRKNTTYTLSLEIVSSSVFSNAAFYTVKANGTIDQPISNQSGSTGTKKIINTGENEKVALLLYSGNATSGTTVYKDIQFEQGSTATEYEAFNGHSTTITLPSTVYGGSVEQGGSGTETIGYVEFDGSSDEAWDIYQADGINQLYIPTADLKGYTLNLYANEFKTISINDRTGNYGTIYASSTAICVNIANIASVADFRAWLSNNNLQVAYELATPTDISVTPFPQTLLEGVNNVWAECSEDGAVIGDAEQELTYQRDTTLVIQNLINRIEELERRN